MSERVRPHGQIARRILGAVLSVLVPGAGHVVIGYTRVGWIVAGASLALGAAVVGCALACAITPFLVLGAAYVFGSVMSVISVFALPPGPRLADGLRALWPVLVLFLVFRGAAYLVQTYALEADVAPDASLMPAIEHNDIVLARLGAAAPRVGQVVVVEHPVGTGARHLRRVTSVGGDSVGLSAGLPDGPLVPASVSRSQLRATALFVFAAARGTNGKDRVWKQLEAAPR